MLEEEKLSRAKILTELEITEDTLSVYENELGINTDTELGNVENFTKEDLDSLQTLHKLRESGLTYNEIKLLSSVSEVLKNVDPSNEAVATSLISLSPIYRLKQSLNLSKQELSVLRTKIQELEELLEKESSNKTVNNSAELEVKQKAINNLDRKLSETLQQKSKLESELALYKEGNNVPNQVRGKKARELTQLLAKKDIELDEAKKKSDELQSKLDKTTEDSTELKERLELLEDEISEIEHEVEERYQEQISSLREQIEALIDKKQQEWEKFYVDSNEQHRKELLTLQRKHEQEILRLKQKIREQIQEIEEIKAIKNPLLSLLNISGKRG
ncbi:MAG: MerR family transcriptional regulator [Candidatus Melainabacteria bacterium]|nr:MerR family transcriptional regulator [Candidatus Melainabacteria bacterium]